MRRRGYGVVRVDAAVVRRDLAEVAGSVHRGRRAADRRRDEWMRRRGYRVVRVDAALVLRDIAEVVPIVQRVVPELVTA